MYLRSIILLVILFAEQILVSASQATASRVVLVEETKVMGDLEEGATEVSSQKYHETSLGLFSGGVRFLGQDRRQGKDPLPLFDEVSEATTEDEESRLPSTLLSDRSDWYVDSVNGDDYSGDGSKAKPFKSIKKVLSINALYEDYLSSGDTLLLAAGDYNQEPLLIDIPQLNIVGTLDKSGKQVSVLGEVKVLADGVTLMNCKFFNAGVTLQTVENVFIFSNIFSGETKTSLSLLGASNNLISRNKFRSSTESAVLIDWDSESGKTSNNNLFLKNHFTHHPSKTTERVILVDWSSGNNRSISFRNRFIGCAFEELASGQLNRIIDDYNPPSMVVEYEYSVRFEDCYFKRADRAAPFSELNFSEEDSDFHWHWDELTDDNWVALNEQYAMTGDRENKFAPRLQFVDGNDDGSPLESIYNIDLLLPGDDFEDSPKTSHDTAVAEDDMNTIKATDLTVETVDSTSKVTDPALETVDSSIKAIDPAIETVGSAVEAIDSSIEKTVPDEDVICDRIDWYVDSMNGDDENGNGSEIKPFKSINFVLSLNENYPAYVGSGDTVHLAAGNYGLESMEIGISGLSIKGTLDEYGKPASILRDTVKITASGVVLMNCEFLDVGLILQNVEDVHISNNIFSGATSISLSLLGASKNKISHNEFRSAIHDCVYIYWNQLSGKVSSDNTFLRNYFTHRPKGVTERVIRVNWSPGENDSISARNRFISCAFKETVSGHLKRIIDDDSTWWMVVDHKYSVQFEDCYFKRADRINPFSEFVVLNGYPEFKWRWDELVNDIWIAANTQFSLTGDYNNWNHKPRL